MTQVVALNNVGKYIDMYNRRFGYYPMQIVMFEDGKAYLKDACDVCRPIPDKVEFNSVWYDFMFDGGAQDESHSVV